MNDAAERTEPAAGDRIRSRVLAALRNEPWAILPEKLELIDQIVVDRLLHGRLVEERAEAAAAPPKGDEPTAWVTIDAGKDKRIAVVNTVGVLSKRLGFFERMSGGASTDQVADVARSLEQDDSIHGVVHAIDSPGGAVSGTGAAAAAWARLAAKKPVFAAANDLMASGAYWIGSAATRIFLPATAAVGSVGVVTMHFDRSKQLAGLGVKPTIIAAGKYKAAGNEYGPLDDESLKIIRDRIGSIYETFIERVAAHRRLPVEHVRDKIADGRVFTGRQAIDVGAADEIGGVEEAIAKLTGELSSASSQGVVLVSTPTTNAGAPSNPPADNPTAGQPAGDVKPEGAATPATPQVDEKAVRDSAIKAERERCQEIRAMCAAAGVEPSLADEFIEKDCSVEATRVRLFDVMKERNKAAGIGGQPANVPASQTPEQREKEIEAKARKEYDDQKAVYTKTGVSFESFLATFKKETAAA